MANRADERDELVSLILGSRLDLTSDEVAEKGGLSPENTRRLWRALGFPDAGDSAAFGTSDAEAVAVVASAIENDILAEDTAFRLIRAVGQTMARLADWQVSTLVDQLERDVEEGKAESRLQAAMALASTAGPALEKLMVHAWRRHVAAAASRLEAQGAVDEELLSTTMSVGFADLSRFTALSNELDDAALARVVETFENRATDLVTSYGGRVIKTLGDAVLYVCPDPVQATRIALEIVKRLSTSDGLPSLRVGLATGSVITRLGDVFGPPVNLAARLSHVARSNRVLVDATTANALGDDFETRVLPPRLLRGFGSISPITVTERRSFRSR
ncbi:adenylate/guanylate cyclase domain-containing protein [uncultured Aeromicrobium sp.]|uniref:adenylate/guanylate cyclase domain-containing protein n=1 Tax=uncultured Aeromicrobium sp. TaxID=337820 RepID=UPI0025E8A336|nr:adenylate/guanylate cyclase domain-containing protein [uncultured Aeromicrobium sp.]